MRRRGGRAVTVRARLPAPARAAAKAARSAVVQPAGRELLGEPPGIAAGGLAGALAHRRCAAASRR